MSDPDVLEQQIWDLLEKKDKHEALNWLNSSSPQSLRNLAELQLDESIRVIKDIYTAGAVTVLAVDFDRNAPYESINTLLVGLPRDRYAREMVFQWAARQAEEQGFDPFDDYGQSHLLVWFD